MNKQKDYPLNEVQKFSSIKEMLEIAVRQVPGKVAFKYKVNKEVKDVTYRECQDDTLWLGEALVELNVADKHIAVIGENSYDWVTVYLTVLKSSGVIVPIDKELPFHNIMNVLKSSDSEVMFYAQKYEKDLMEHQDELSNIKYFVGFSREKDDGKFLSYKLLKEKGKKLIEAGSKKYSEIKPEEGKLKMLVYTSGTTGMAKGVMLSEHNLVNSVYHGLRVSTVYERCLSVLPYHHTYEAVSGLLVSLHHHSTICINENLKTVQKNLQLYKPDYVYLVPAFVEVFYKKIWSNAKQTGKEKALKILIKISNFLRKIGIDLRRKLFKSVLDAFGGNLIKIVCGGAPIRAELGEFFDDIEINLNNGYGITECSPLVSANRDYFNEHATVGSILPCCEVKIENKDEDGNGEILVKGDVVMMGYYKNPKLTEEVLKNGWFNTGDYGRINEKGQLMITGRKKNLIVLDNGKNVFPEEIEGYIMSIPYVLEVIVRGIKNDEGIETGLSAEVVLNEESVKEMGIENPQESLRKDITEVTKELPMYKRVSKVILRETPFEKTTSNKIKRG